MSPQRRRRLIKLIRFPRDFNFDFSVTFFIQKIFKLLRTSLFDFFPEHFFESYFPLFLSFRFFPERIFTFPRKELWPFPRKWRLLVLQKGKKSTCLWSYCAFVSFFIQKVIGGVTAFKKTGNFFPRLCLFKPLSPPGSKSKVIFIPIWVRWRSTFFSQTSSFL